MESKINIPDDCNIEHALAVLHKKWNIIILYLLYTNQSLRFSQLQQRIDGISPKVLAAHLKHLEKANVLTRTVYPTNPPQTEYALTEHGRALEPIIRDLHTWGEKLN